jgi:hypothetical protein
MARDKKTDTAYKNAYQKENYDRIGVLLPKGEKDRLKERLGTKSINSYVLELIQKDIEGK